MGGTTCSKEGGIENEERKRVSGTSKGNVVAIINRQRIEQIRNHMKPPTHNNPNKRKHQSNTTNPANGNKTRTQNTQPHTQLNKPYSRFLQHLTLNSNETSLQEPLVISSIESYVSFSRILQSRCGLS